jgi:Zn-dependent protease with chaperone function
MATPLNLMTSKNQSFVKLHILPALLVLIIPAFSAWFFAYAEDWMDGEVLSAVEADVARSNLPEEKRTAILNFYRSNPVSRMMAADDPQALKMQETFAPTKLRYATFRWMKRIAWICLATIPATLVIVGVSVWFSFRSNAAQYYALRIGWPVLRTSAAVQVLGQGILAVALSFWVTAIWTQSYYVKLIGIIGLLAACGVIALWKAIFAKVDDRFNVEGEIVSEAEAPALAQRIREMANRLNTAPPDRVIVGIVPSFFVTEHPVTIGDVVHDGRTLFVSLPMLKVLALDEADAVLGHELAHFSGEDTLWSRKVSPLKIKFAVYLQMLSNGLSLPVAHFMHAFWKLYNLSLGRLSRAREFRADRIGAELTSAASAKRALIKVTSYCDFRAETERAILARERVDEGLNLALNLEQGYPAFLSSFVQNSKANEERVPHPFDSHPTLSNRLEHLGFDPQTALDDEAIHQAPAASWYQEISTAHSIEERLWTKRQAVLQEYHQHDLLWRLLPKNEEQAAMIREHFPRLVFCGKKGGQAILEFDRIQLAEWNSPLFFRDILTAQVDTTWARRNLVLSHSKEAGRGSTSKIPLRAYEGGLLESFGKYFSRHKTAEVRSRETSTADQG